MGKFISFKKIGQYRQVIGDIKHEAQYQGIDGDGNPIFDRNAKLPTLTFKGTVKLHGTNAGIAQGGDGEIWYQSRKGIITPQKDNAGFAFFADTHKDIFENMFGVIRDRIENDEDNIVIFGEWCGGNIQKGVAINGLDKMFVIFAVKVAPISEDKDNYYLGDIMWSDLSSHDDKIYNINDFPSWTVDIDFENPERARNEMIEIMANVEKECPVGQAFGRKVGEDNTTGEGNVWKGWYKGTCLMFKVKGEKHSVTKVKTLAPVDIEKMNSIDSFVDYAVTGNRLNQGIEQVFTIESVEPSVKDTGKFLKWVSSDIITEEADTLAENGLEPKDVGRAISKKARDWFMDYLDSLV